jgi:hypothetical protein
MSAPVLLNGSYSAPGPNSDIACQFESELVRIIANHLSNDVSQFKSDVPS